MWDDDLAPFWIIKNLFLSAKSSWSYSFGCWGGSYMNSLPPESPKEEMVLLKLQRWVKNAAAGVSRTSGVQSVCAGWQLGLLVENLNKSVPNPGEQGHEETFPSDGISFACSSINVCIIPFKGKVPNVYFWVSLPSISIFLPTSNKRFGGLWIWIRCWLCKRLIWGWEIQAEIFKRGCSSAAAFKGSWLGPGKFLQMLNCLCASISLLENGNWIIILLCIPGGKISVKSSSGGPRDIQACSEFICPSSAVPCSYNLSCYRE